MSHRWTHPTPRIRTDGTVIEQGNEFEPTELEQKCWPDRFEEIDVVEETDDEAAGDEGA